MYESYKMKCRYEFYRGSKLIYTTICHINDISIKILERIYGRLNENKNIS